MSLQYLELGGVPMTDAEMQIARDIAVLERAKARIQYEASRRPASEQNGINFCLGCLGATILELQRA